MVDDFNREILHIEVDTSLSSDRLVRVFEQLKRDHGLPKVLRSDNGPEFLGEAFTVGQTQRHGVAIHAAGQTQAERLHRTLQPHVPWRSWTSTSSHVLRKFGRQRNGWMIDYNEIRPHDSLGGMGPVEYRTAHARSSTSEMSA